MHAGEHLVTIPDCALALLWAAELMLTLWTLRVAQFFVYRMGRVIRDPLAPIDIPAAVILPVKGLEPSTRSNIEKLLNQDYPHVRYIFSVQSSDDPVCPLIRSLIDEFPGRNISLVIAGPAQTRSQKIHNQLAAVDQTTPDDKFLAFIDADAAPSPHWLHALLIPLTYPHISATTGYRFYIPQHPSAPNALLSVGNAMVAAMLGPYRRTVAWGGSMAISREKFFSLGIYDAWQCALSDDYVLSYQVKKHAGERIHFVPQCMVASPADMSTKALLEFAVRQYRITRRCAARLWFTAVAGSGVYLATILSAAILSIAPAGIWAQGWYRFIPPGVLLLVWAGSMLRGWFLMRAGKILLPQHSDAIGRCWVWFTVLFPAVQAFNMFCLLLAGFGKTITWRGIRYQMIGRTQTRIISPKILR
jgi:cellulose synthase/poly-beta-1,6-N-acetylglucosamine synthase-like glycosyltransferase